MIIGENIPGEFLCYTSTAMYHGCHVKMETPQNGDPGSRFSCKIRDPGPQFSSILGTLGSPILNS